MGWLKGEVRWYVLGGNEVIEKFLWEIKNEGVIWFVLYKIKWGEGIIEDCGGFFVVFYLEESKGKSVENSESGFLIG